jgi:hypothetical protein
MFFAILGFEDANNGVNYNCCSCYLPSCEVSCVLLIELVSSDCGIVVKSVKKNHFYYFLVSCRKAEAQCLWCLSHNMAPAVHDHNKQLLCNRTSPSMPKYT